MKQKKEVPSIERNVEKKHESDIDLPFLDSLVDEVATGRRILFFPPGKIIFVFTMSILPLFPSILLAARSVEWFGAALSPIEHAAAPLISGPISIVFTLIPLFLIAHGKKKYVEVTRYYYRFLFLTSSIFLAYFGVVYSELNIPFLLASISSSFGLWLMRTPSYQLFVEYMYRLKKRKLEIYEEEQQTNL